MKAPDFDYARPSSLQEALALLAAGEGGAQPLAGGQSLMPMLNFRISTPEMLVDLSGLPELRGLEQTPQGLRIGAMTRYCELEAFPDLAKIQPLVAAALPHIAHDAIRNRGTIGGSVALADPAAEMPAILLALGAVISLDGPNGPRDVAADDYFLGYYETACEPDELITSILLPKIEPGDSFGFHELVQRHGDYAMAGVAIRSSGIAPLAGLRIGFFGVADRALRVTALEDALNGTDGTDIAGALSHLSEIDFQGDTKITAETRAHYAGVALKRALKEMLT
ncbi:FAD binding domain-containing protein [Flavimaricola marinus]|uniref:Caffeine dehydrogenase subunit beta n=1 Tax=Flavimaricola marinus TaxID=1819565 RepID=A0A238LEJ3_9RHOB|nr:xanthine dehydrogenase family protein subunit M [Flavimaricola marinus]SMY08051.1 Caffeine dehydrogenase subunit beta [Flavimaricola marinus]